jgi:hypothetical protein
VYFLGYEGIGHKKVFLKIKKIKIKTKIVMGKKGNAEFCTKQKFLRRHLILKK